MSPCAITLSLCPHALVEIEVNLASSQPPPLIPPHPAPPISLGADVTGLDPSPANIDVARTHAAVDPLTQGIRYEAASVEEFIGASRLAPPLEFPLEARLIDWMGGMDGWNGWSNQPPLFRFA